jgi:predicted helicase
MADKNLFDRYLLALRKTPLDEKTEHTDRSALETLLQAIADETGSNAEVQHEPKRVTAKGAPDFKVRRGGLIIGYVENKQIGENLDKVLRSEQIKKYLELSKNIILTDYLHFIWINENGIQREILCHSTDVENPKFKLKEDRAEAVAKLLQGFFSSAPEGIGRAQQLALALATRSRLLRDYLGDELVRQEKESDGERLYGLFQIFKKQVFHELTLKEFADAFAQMLAYGLFLAKLNSEGEAITLRNARDFIPGSFQLIRELVDFLPDLEKDEYRDIRWVVEEILSIVNGLKLAEIQNDLSFSQRKVISRKVKAKDEEEHRLFERDPFIYFYEDYLKAYDKDTRKARGVYYTPPPVVNFIVRAIDDILKDKEIFNIKDGLADNKKVTVLDFACGTGTFLLEIFQRIFDNIGGSENARAGLVVREHILKNLYGFEYLIAPYTIAHLKLSQYLKEQKHPLRDKERLQVFLTNTLEPIEPAPHFLLPAITAEAEAAQKVKDKPILVITGNPPYSGHSKNKGAWITTAIDGYKHTVETDAEGREVHKPLGERNPKWLNDDYVKFIRFAQLKMDAVDEGIVGIITNHSWLDNPTFRGMRQSLMRSFEQIYVLDLHGNAKKKERAPDGSKDENVFEIEQGVAISIFIKRKNLEQGVWVGDVWGKQLSKYNSLASDDLRSSDLKKISPSAPLTIFALQDESKKAKYEKGVSLIDIFQANSVGFVTARDNLTIQFSKADSSRVVNEFVKLESEVTRSTFSLGKDVRDWRVEWAQEDLRNTGLSNKNIKQVLYRPFDFRWTYYTGKSRGFHCYPRNEIMQHLTSGENIALLSARVTKDDPSALVSFLPTAHKASTRYDITYVFPLRTNRVENLAAEFRNELDTAYSEHYTPEEVLGFIYAVLNSPSYRIEYDEFLRLDFPRIPFPEDSEDFESLSGLGWALVEAHLLRNFPRKNLAAYHGKGDHTVEFVRYSPEEKSIAINTTQLFKPVPEEVWNFHIGGYQVLDKYLKSRKRRALSLDEINHVSAVADSLAFTIEQMTKIDKAYKAAFPDRG